MAPTIPAASTPSSGHSNTSIPHALGMDELPRGVQDFYGGGGRGTQRSLRMQRPLWKVLGLANGHGLVKLQGQKDRDDATFLCGVQRPWC
uniref:Uncharacterized protein n=1 Tax=Oryza barthii TaxID=65489 RepID=A0A0D3H1S7_9ORYZ